MNDNEEWRAVSGHPDYEVSSLGRVRSWKRAHATGQQPHIMRPFLHPLGYARIRMDSRQYSVHRLVAAAWTCPCPEGKEVDHINNVRDDNRPENLRYLTRQENMARARNAIATHCPQDHPYSGDNLLIVATTGERKCRICRRQSTDEFRARFADVDIPEDAHGTANGYSNYECRCDPCKRASSEYRRKKRQRRAA